jgi:hypothetical protein
MPVILDHIESYKHEYQQLYDKVMAKVGMLDNKLITIEMQERSNKLLNRIEKILLKRYPNSGLWPELKTQKAWFERVDEYGPVAVARSEAGDMAYIILDVPIN